MAKLETLKRNIQKAQNVRARLKELADIVHPVEHDPYQRIDGPPRALAEQYIVNLRIFINEKILGDSTHTQEQRASLIESHLMDQYNQLLLQRIMINRDTYWRPRVTFDDHAIRIYLSHYLLAEIN